jgi:hypothetical protein
MGTIRMKDDWDATGCSTTPTASASILDFLREMAFRGDFFTAKAFRDDFFTSKAFRGDFFTAKAFRDDLRESSDFMDVSMSAVGECYPRQWSWFYKLAARYVFMTVIN